MDNKIDLRVYAKDARKALNIELISGNIVEKIRTLDVYNSAKDVMLFYPLKYEIDLRDLLNDDKNFYLPKVSGENILVCPYSDNLAVSKFGVKEPQTEPVNPEILDLVIVPCLMADKSGYRLGYGAGFYDRFLKDFCVKTITVVAKQLFVDKLPIDKTDVKTDIVIAS